MLCYVHVGLVYGKVDNTDARPFQKAMAKGQVNRDARRFSEAIQQFQLAADLARQDGTLNNDQRTEAASKALIAIGTCQLTVFQYAKALQSFDKAQTLGLQLPDKFVAGVAAANLSTIYLELGDFSMAENRAQDSVNLLSGSAKRKELERQNRDHLAKSLVTLAFVQANNGELELSRASYQKAIHAAHTPGVLSLAWDQFGTSLLLSNRLPEAESAIKAALEIQKKSEDKEGLAFTDEHLAELELRKPKGDLNSALRLINQAFEMSQQNLSREFKESPKYYPLHIKGQILLGLHRETEALVEFRRSVDEATKWRRGALPGDTTSTRTVARLDQVYHDYAQLAASLALKRNDEALLEQAFLVLTENRAAALREQLIAAFGRDLRLPPEYFSLLSALQEAQAKVTLGKNPTPDKVQLDKIRLQLDELENKFGLQISNSASPHEKFRTQNSLRDIQRSLSERQLLLSFCLGEPKSFVWAISKDRVRLYELQDEQGITSKAQQFFGAVKDDRNTSAVGQDLSRTLFSKLSPEFSDKPEWLLDGEGPLLTSVPFSALPEETPGQIGQPLLARHSIRLLPSAFLLTSPKSQPPEPYFVGLGDPVYNLADRRRPKVQFQKVTDRNASVGLARLVGSERELKTASSVSGIKKLNLLIGPAASGQELRKALADRPEIVHFAVHVVSPPDQPQEAALALTLTGNGMPELLTPEVIATYRVPGSLIVLSGCASQQGKALPGAGLIGLSRSWLLAGASAVVVSAWPTPDDSGSFFAAFYKHLQSLTSGSLAQRAAAALQNAQLDMQHEHSYRSSPSFWAAYSIISKE